jgi:hypothetical protein
MANTTVAAALGKKNFLVAVPFAMLAGIVTRPAAVSTPPPSLQRESTKKLKKAITDLCRSKKYVSGL